MEWRSDGRELYYRAPDDMLMVAAVEGTGSLFQASSPQSLFRMATVLEPGRRQLWATADGKRFLINTRLEGTTRQTLTVVLNWKAGAKSH